MLSKAESHSPEVCPIAKKLCVAVLQEQVGLSKCSPSISGTATEVPSAPEELGSVLSSPAQD